MVKIDWSPDDRQLWRFGWIGLAGFSLIGWAVSLIAPQSDAIGIWIVFGALALACGLFALLSPKRLKPIYLLVMGVAFVVTYPLALIFGMFGLGPSGADAPPDGSGSGDFGGKAGNIPDDGRSED